MSKSHLEWALEQNPGSASVKMVLVILAHNADAKGRVTISQDSIADEANCSVPNVKRILKNLRAFKLITSTSAADKKTGCPKTFVLTPNKQTPQ